MHKRTGTSEGDIVRLQTNGALPAIAAGSLTGLTAKEFLLYMGSDQAYGTVSVGTKANLTAQNPAGTISVTNGVITLPANSKCFLFFYGGMIGASHNGSWSEWQWYDVTGVATPIGIIGAASSPRASYSVGAAGAVAAYVETAGTTKNVEVRCVAEGITIGLESNNTAALIRIYQ